MQTQQSPAAETAQITGGRWSEIEFFLFKTRFASFLQLWEALFSNSSKFGIWINWSNDHCWNCKTELVMLPELIFSQEGMSSANISWHTAIKSRICNVSTA